LKALLTGASGFIGSNLARELLRQGFEVRALVRPGCDTRNIDGLNIELSQGDLRDRPSLEQAAQGCQVLFHVAADYSFWVPDVKAMYQTNVEGTRSILEVALRAGMSRAVYTSTVATVGLPRDGRPGTEELEPQSKDLVGHYKKSKYLAEKAALEVQRLGLPLVVVNPTTPIGPGDLKPTPTGKIIVDFLNRRMPAYVNTGLNFIDVEDVAKGHILALEKGKVGERYILGNRNLSLREVFQILEKITGIKAPKVRIPIGLALVAAYADELVSGKLRRKPPRIPLAGVKMSRKPMYYSAAKAVAELGLPQSPLDAAFEKAVRWYYEQGYA